MSTGVEKKYDMVKREEMQPLFLYVLCVSRFERFVGISRDSFLSDLLLLLRLRRKSSTSVSRTLSLLLSICRICLAVRIRVRWRAGTKSQVKGQAPSFGSGYAIGLENRQSRKRTECAAAAEVVALRLRGGADVRLWLVGDDAGWTFAEGQSFGGELLGKSCRRGGTEYGGGHSVVAEAGG